MNIDLEFGDYRIIYELNQNELIILVTKQTIEDKPINNSFLILKS